MTKKIILLFCLSIITIIVNGQDYKKFYWDNGKLKHEGQVKDDRQIGLHKKYYESGELQTEMKYDSIGLLYEIKEYDKFGNILSFINYNTIYKDYPIKDFSEISWTKITDSVYIYKYNNIDTNIVISDKSYFEADYQCYLSNGRLIDNSFDNCCKMNDQVGNLIEGLKIGIKKMKPGESALIKIDPSMGNGNIVRNNIPAHSTLIYLIKLVSIN